MENDGLFLTVEQAADRLNLNPETIRRRIRKGTIKAQLEPGPRGDQYQIPISELNTQDAELVPAPQLPVAIVSQITAANAAAVAQAMEAVVAPLQAQIEQQQQLIQAQSELINKMQTSVDNAANLQAKTAFENYTLLQQVLEQQKAAQEAAEAPKRSLWQRLIGG